MSCGAPPLVTRQFPVPGFLFSSKIVWFSGALRGGSVTDGVDVVAGGREAVDGAAAGPGGPSWRSCRAPNAAASTRNSPPKANRRRWRRRRRLIAIRSRRVSGRRAGSSEITATSVPTHSGGTRDRSRGKHPAYPPPMNDHDRIVALTDQLLAEHDPEDR